MVVSVAHCYLLWIGTSVVGEPLSSLLHLDIAIPCISIAISVFGVPIVNGVLWGVNWTNASRLPVEFPPLGCKIMD